MSDFRYVPALQLKQLEEEVAPNKLADMTAPPGHGVQKAAPAAAKVPGLHKAHAEGCVAPAVEEALPAGHCVHTEAMLFRL